MNKKRILCPFPDKKTFTEKLKVTAVLLVAVAVMYLLEIPCIIKAISGYDCPGCGMTRALLSVARFDFAGAFSYHRMFWSVPLLYVFFVFDGKVFENKWLNRSVLVLIAMGFLMNYVGL